jgi:Raf kinase inhibitor-like YbhB/YbcL family protein
MATLSITSTAFREGQRIPARYTCDGENVSPPLNWEGAPDTAKAFALICDDPDAPRGTWVHWLIWNLPATAQGLPQAVPADRELEDGSRQGTTDFGTVGYGGPCPPGGTHRYYFRLYALDAPLELPPGATRPQLDKALEGHVLARGQLMGRYSRQK